MNRRSFLGTLVGGVATAAAVRTWPFRVYSFPSAITMMDPAIEQLMIKHVIAWNGSHELWALNLRPGVLDKLIEREYGWNDA